MAASTLRGPEAVSGPARSQWRLAALLGALSMVSPFSIDTFFPSFHAIAADFCLSRGPSSRR